MPNKKGAVIAIDSKESQWSKDMRAYRALRKQGLQPKGIDGSDVLEAKAATREDIEFGHIFDRKQVAEAKAGIERAREMRAV